MMFATPEQDWQEWNYLQGNIHTTGSIGVQRFFHLLALAQRQDGFLIALHDPVSGAWTKHRGFYNSSCRDYASLSTEQVQNAYDVHRSILENEIVIESDYLCSGCTERKKEKKSAASGCYDCYLLNYEATRVIGRIIEDKGFVPHYYYSGNKSLHISVYFDFACLLTVDLFLQHKIIAQFKTRGTFIRRFMEWLRRLMINCWGVKVRSFDEQLIKGTHLIRCELSKNKVGYKTFLGHTYKDVSFIPNICNAKNKILPSLGELILSRPLHPQALLEEFLTDTDTYRVKMRIDRKQTALAQWFDDEKPGVKPCVQFLLSDDFRTAGDGYQRAMFILANELKKVYGEAEALDKVLDWNERMGSPCREQEVMYRVTRSKEYTLGCAHVHVFLAALGFDDHHTTTGQ